MRPLYGHFRRPLSKGGKRPRHTIGIERLGAEPVNVSRHAVSKTQAETGAAGKEELLLVNDTGLQRDDASLGRVQDILGHLETPASKPKKGRSGMSSFDRLS